MTERFETYQSYRSSAKMGPDVDTAGSPSTSSNTEQEYYRSYYKRNSSTYLSNARFSSQTVGNSSAGGSPIQQPHLHELRSESYGERPESRGNDSSNSTCGYSPQRDSLSSSQAGSPAVESGLANARSLSFGKSFGSPTFFASPGGTTSQGQRSFLQPGGSNLRPSNGPTKRFDPLGTGSAAKKKKTRKPREILYAASSEDVCPLAILLYAQGVKVTVPDTSYVSLPKEPDLEAKRKSIMDKYLDVLAELGTLLLAPYFTK